MILSRKTRSVFWIKKKKKKEEEAFWKRIYIHTMNLFHMHHIHKKKIQPNFQFLLLNFKTYNFITKKTFLKKPDLYLMKIQISFVFFLKKIRSEKYRSIFWIREKKSYLYLMKIQICFMLKKNQIWIIQISFLN